MEKYIVTTDYKVISNTDEETKIKEVETYTFVDYARNYARELAIKKDKAIITAWLKALGDKELLNVYNWIKEVMEERGINAKR